MSGTTVEIKAEKREREEDEAEPAVVKDSDVPAAKKLKAEDGAEVSAAATASSTAEAALSPADASKTAGEAAPAAMDEDTKGGEAAAETAAPAVPAVSEETKKEKEAEALKMLEFYFGDSNFGWDRFMQSKAGKMGENLMDVSILMTFNKLKKIVKDAGLSSEEGMALIARLGEASPHLRVSEDKKQIGRAEPLTEEKKKERLARTVQTKGYKKDSKMQIEDVEKLFAETGKARYVKICKIGGNKLTSIFVEFETKEQAEKAVEQSEKYSYEEEAISVRPAKGDDDKPKSAEGAPEPLPEVVYEAGKILHIVDIPESGVSRESLKNAVQSFGNALFVDFSFGAREAWIRMEHVSEAAAALNAAKDVGLELAPEVEQKGTVSLLEGDDEKTYYERVEKLKAERNNRSNSRGRGRGRRGKGRGGGRGRGRGDGGGGN
eukprot:g14394.t1